MLYEVITQRFAHRFGELRKRNAARLAGQAKEQHGRGIGFEDRQLPIDQHIV